jgi:hypothetical protein
MPSRTRPRGGFWRVKSSFVARRSFAVSCFLCAASRQAETVFVFGSPAAPAESILVEAAQCMQSNVSTISALVMLATVTTPTPRAHPVTILQRTAVSASLPLCPLPAQPNTCPLPQGVCADGQMEVAGIHSMPAGFRCDLYRENPELAAETYGLL